MKVTAVVIGRKGSQRVLDKIHQPIGGEPLLLRKVRQLKECKNISEVVVGSDDTTLATPVQDLGASFFEREQKYCDEKSATVNEVVKNMLGFIDTDLVVWAHPTNPFLEAYHYDTAINLFKLATPEFDSLFCATKLEGHFWTDWPAPINHNPKATEHIVAAKLPPIYSQNGGMFIRPYNDMAEDGRFIGQKPYLFTVSADTGWDIDEPWEMEVAKCLAK